MTLYRCVYLLETHEPGLPTELPGTGTSAYPIMLTCIFIIIVIIGEFGIVYRAHLVKNSLKSVTTLPVAVKMMKGIVIVTYSHL